jgi:hypothetical protein
MSPRKLGPVAILLLVSGCELLFGIKESPSGTGGNAAAGSHATSSQATSTTAPSSGATGGASTSGATTSSSTTATSTSTASSSTSGSSSGSVEPFCASQVSPYFCADFDEGGFGGWTDTTDIHSPLTGLVDSTDALSKPGSFHVYAPAGVGTGCTSARLHESLPSNWTELQVQLDYAGCAGLPQGSGALDFVTLDCTVAGNTGGLVRWGLHATGDQVAIYGVDGGKLGALDGGAPETDGGFTHVELDVTFGAPGAAELKLDGSIIGNGAFDIGCAGGTLGVAIGILDCDDANLACTIHVDNVVITGH